MNLLLFLLVAATTINGLLAGLNVDTALVKLPARRRIGVVAYATFARGNDLGNGLLVYPLLGIGAALLTVLATLFAFVSHTRMEVVLSLSVAALLSVLHAFATSRAAPIMLSLKNAPDDEALLAAKLDRFARWHALRATLQVVAFFVLLWTLVVA
ncbi:hypothetical protein [Ktedonobacter racemifer]|uniref:Integral-membrane protein n=1 Tax=Ktedonobacter racemifer DSM 44963 TaxID=485913 RepID=D6TM89_KTERA|nr:hypothetical protein [Ktedonobacter racemifer]EFH86889.1 integral-membrane protein [Ktedonobacter racemifer DSM 44963]